MLMSTSGTARVAVSHELMIALSKALAVLSTPPGAWRGELDGSGGGGGGAGGAGASSSSACQAAALMSSSTDIDSSCGSPSANAGAEQRQMHRSDAGWPGSEDAGGEEGGGAGAGGCGVTGSNSSDDGVHQLMSSSDPSCSRLLLCLLLPNAGSHIDLELHATRTLANMASVRQYRSQLVVADGAVPILLGLLGRQVGVCLP